jgi:hypothetical protein
MTKRGLAQAGHLTLTYISELEAAGAAPDIDLLERLAHLLKVKVSDLLSVPHTAKTSRARVEDQFNSVLAKAGAETLSMLALFLARLAESAAVNR